MAMVNKVSSHCPSCGAGMEVDRDAGVLRCSYCQHEVLIPAAQQSPPNWAYGASQAGPPRVTFTTTSTPVTLSPEQAKKAKRAMWIVAAVALAPITILIVTITFFVSDATGLGSNKPIEVAIGEAAHVQSFEATVHSINCDKQTISKPDDPATEYDDTRTSTAKGKYCIIALSVKNVGTKTERFQTSGLEAKSPTERVLDRDYSAETNINNGKGIISGPLDDVIDPGKVVDTNLVFDVPVDTTLANLRIFWDLYSDTTATVKVA